jgi:hypothetical protein
MPAFNLAPIEDDSAFEPVIPTAPAQGGGGGGGSKPQQRKPVTRAEANQRIEKAAGPLKPLAQFVNALASPDAKAGLVTGPINAISKLGNAIGDAIQRKPIDTRDAWRIPDAAARAVNPFRIGPTYGEVTPADEAGMQLGGAIGGEIVGAVTGTTLLRRLGQVAQIKRAGDALKATRAVRGLAVAQRANPALRTGVSVTQKVGEALVGTTAAVPFIDMDQNLANLGDAFGLRLPGRADETDNYLTRVGKGLLVEGIAPTLSVIGAASFVPALRRAMFGGPTLLDDLADAELAPYMYRGTDAPQLPPGAETPQLPSTQMQAAANGGPITPARIEVDAPGRPLPGTPPDAPALPTYEPGGALVPTTPNGSAIERYLDESTQIRQVEQQRERLASAGLVEQGEAGQLQLNVGAAVDPEIKLQIRQLQTQRGLLLRQAPERPEAIEEIAKQLDEIDQQIADLNLAGSTEEFLAPRGSRQGELDLDTRPEIDTYLAQLDELDDSQLRDIHSRVYRQEGEARNAEELTATQQRVDELTQRVADIEARQASGELTPRGAKGQLTRAQRELQMAQQQLMAVQQRLRVPETLVGDQLELTIQQQLGLDLVDPIELPPIPQSMQRGTEFGYQTPDDYRGALQAWPRDLLRRLAMPDSSPEVAALVKARTGRRVWQAKKGDIIDALVELSERRGRYLPPEPEQLTAPLTTNLAGADGAPLLDVPADLSTTSPMGRIVDADGNEVTVPVAEFQPRGMDAETRERLKMEILRRAIDNGEVQAPITPIPNRPAEPQFFQQQNFVDDLLSDETGQMAMLFNSDALPPYKAGGKNADALIDEMRLRFEYNLLDAKSMQAQKDALMAAYGWDRLSWEEKKRLGLMGRGIFRMSRDELTSPVDVVRPATPGFNPELPVSGERAPQPYRGDGVETPQFTPELQPKPQRKPAVYDTKSVYVSINGEAMVVPKEAVPAQPKPAAKGKGKAKPTTAEAKAAKAALNDVANTRAELAKQLEELRKQSQGGSC